MSGHSASRGVSTVGLAVGVSCWLLVAHLLAHVTLASGAEETNSQTLKPVDTNAPRLAVSNAPTPHVADTNAPVLTTIDTNAFVPGAIETNPVIIRDARGPGRLDLESFRLIWERNIFDPNRSPFNRFTRSAPPPRDRERRRTDSFALIGTMSYEKGRFAFFEGSSPQYQKVLETSNSIGDYTITAITPSHVLLQSTNGQIELPVGMQMKREDEGPWSLAERAHSSEGYRRASDSSSGPVSSGDASEALRRLMERREKEGGGESTNASETPPSETKPEPKAEPADSPEKTNAPAPAGADEVLKRLLEKREQEVNK
jgi:hypothetical protein